jgi:aspartate carbamoyltransferase regulatory subunit
VSKKDTLKVKDEKKVESKIKQIWAQKDKAKINKIKETNPDLKPDPKPEPKPEPVPTPKEELP